MNTVTVQQIQKTESNIKQNKLTILDKYMKYVNEQQSLAIYHYLVVIIAIPCVYMTTSIIAMAAMVDWFVYFIAFAMILFFANMVVHIAEAKSKIFIPLFHLTTLLFIAIPVITYFLTQ